MRARQTSSGTHEGVTRPVFGQTCHYGTGPGHNQRLAVAGQDETPHDSPDGRGGPEEVGITVYGVIASQGKVVTGDRYVDEAPLAETGVPIWGSSGFSGERLIGSRAG